MNEQDLSSLPFLGSEMNQSPQAVVDDASITNCMSKNKESLKKKLLLRRPVDVLVDQGILPPPKSSPTFYEQRHRLERAKTEDFLKRKIQSRPNRNELIQQHILEDSFDPSYYEQQRKLKKARLADDLNERLSHRPGPLELIKGNILHTDETFEQAIKEGQITFKKTCEGEIITNPPKRFVFEEESSSDSAPSPTIQKNHISLAQGCQVKETPFVLTATLPSTTLELAASNLASSSGQLSNANISYILNSTNCLPIQTAGDDKRLGTATNLLANTIPFPTLISNNILTQTLNPTANLFPLTNIEQPSVQANKFPTQLQCQQVNNIQKPKKKVKSKNQAKARVIKFHEYTGPPNVKKSVNSKDNETSYDLLLKQQQLFLQWQLECQQKFPDLVGHQSNKPEGMTSEDMAKINEIINKAKEDRLANGMTITSNEDKFVQPSSDETNNKTNQEKHSNDVQCVYFNANGVKQQNMPIIKKIISKLEDMKVNDLKAELKKRNLPVSGPKQQLIERLRPFSDNVVSDNNNGFLVAESVNLMNQSNCINNNANQFGNSGETIKVNNITTICNPVSNPAFILNNPTMCKNSIKVNGEEYVLLTNNNSVDTLSSLQFKSTLESTPTTLTIPIGGHSFIPQYQIVSSTPTNNSFPVNLANNTLQPRLSANNVLVNNNNKLSIINPAGNFTQHPNASDKSFSLPIFTPASLMKSNISLMTIPNTTPVIHQVLLYPNCLNQTEDITSASFLQKQRSNSLPGETMHQLQRNKSMPLVGEKVSQNVKVDDKKTTPSKSKTKSYSVGKNKFCNSQATIMETEKATLKNDSPAPKNMSNNLTTIDANLQIGEVTTNITASMNNQFEQPNNVSTNIADAIQPDSTTNALGNNFDLDFILNFDDLHDLGDGGHNVGKTCSEMMDLNDNWLEMALAGTTQTNDNTINGKNSIHLNNNAFESSVNNNYVSQSDIDSILSFDASMSHNEAMILDDLSSLAQSLINNNQSEQQQQQQATIAQPGCSDPNNFATYNKRNYFNNSDSIFNDNFFCENDFKSAIDSIL